MIPKQPQHRPIASLLASFVASLALVAAACGGDDDGADDTDSPASPSAYIGPAQFSIDEALDELTSIEEMIRNPDPAQIAQFGIAQSAVDARVRDALEGVPNTMGLNEVRRLLEAGPEGENSNRILAGETLYNITFATIIPPFGAADASAIPSDEIAELDPLHSWAVDFEDGLPTTAIWRDTVARIIFLWYRL